jgi:hypothetical protein
MEEEIDNSTNFLDITIKKVNNTCTTDIYRKPTATDSIIPRDSCHPQEHKHAAIRHMTNRMNTYRLSQENKVRKKNTIKHILSKNKFDTSLIDKFTHTKSKEKQPLETRKWAKFTYIGNETKFTTKLFKDSSIKITFTTNNTITKILSTKAEPPQKQYNSGVYQLTCPDCYMKYIGQTGRPFIIWFAEHFRDYKYNSNKSKFAQHLLENRHSIGPIDEIMEILYKTNKWKLMDTIENYHIYKETQLNNQVNDKNTIKPNIISDTTVQANANRGRTTN